jgi:hypothetical protein
MWFFRYPSAIQKLPSAIPENGETGLESSQNVAKLLRGTGSSRRSSRGSGGSRRAGGSRGGSRSPRGAGSSRSSVTRRSRGQGRNSRGSRNAEKLNPEDQKADQKTISIRLCLFMTYLGVCVAVALVLVFFLLQQQKPKKCRVPQASGDDVQHGWTYKKGHDKAGHLLEPITPVVGTSGNKAGNKALTHNGNSSDASSNSTEKPSTLLPEHVSCNRKEFGFPVAAEISSCEAEGADFVIECPESEGLHKLFEKVTSGKLMDEQTDGESENRLYARTFNKKSLLIKAFNKKSLLIKAFNIINRSL